MALWACAIVQTSPIISYNRRANMVDMLTKTLRNTTSIGYEGAMEVLPKRNDSIMTKLLSDDVILLCTETDYYSDDRTLELEEFIPSFF